MSGLGTAIEPTGEPGSVTGASPLEPETLPSQDASIAQTTSINTLPQIIGQDYVRKDTYTISTAMPAGTVFFAFRIHPLECNYILAYICLLFNAWTGGMKIRTRIPATAWYGGSIRIGRLPPNMTEQEVFNAPLDLLTAHPNMDLDPKNTSWIHFNVSDQRPIAYHYFNTPVTDPNYHGGWVVGYLASRLVTQSPDFTQVEMIVECAGDFTFDQLAPTNVLTKVVQDPLASVSQIPLEIHPILDSVDVGAQNVFQVCPIAITSLPVGAVRLQSVGQKEPYGKVTGITTVYNHFADLRSKKPTTISAATYQKDLGPTWYISSGDELYPVNTDGTGLGCNLVADINGAHQILTYTSYDTDAAGPPNMTFTVQTSSDGEANLHKFGLTCSDSAVPLDPSKGLPASGTPLLQVSPQAGGESIVVFGNLRTRTFAAQTELIASAVGRYPQDVSNGNTSWVYNIRNAAGTPLLTVRLNPNGMFTAKSSPTALVFSSVGCHLDYLGPLPLSDPLPAPSQYQRMMYNDIRNITRRCADRGVKNIAFCNELREMLQAY